MITERPTFAYGDTRPSVALVALANSYLVQALVPEDDERMHVWARGVFAGYLVAFGVSDTTDLDVAASIYRAHPHMTLDAALSNAPRSKSLVDEDGYLFACGVLHGFKEGTAERSDAEECAACGRRICTDAPGEDYQSCEHGVMCEGRDCFADVHSALGYTECDPMADDRAEAVGF